MMYGAQVFQVRKRDTGRIYAMKVMRKVRPDSPNPECLPSPAASASRRRCTFLPELAWQV